MDEYTGLDEKVYRFRVHNGHGHVHFDNLIDATAFCKSCAAAGTVDLRWPDGRWKALYTDGEVVYTRPGFGVLIPAAKIAAHRTAVHTSAGGSDG